jgi:hypothetical protein
VTVDYTTLSLVAVRTGLDEVVCDTQATFGGLDSRQLNWRPDATRWSVAQCFEHLLAANSVMFRAADEALNGSRPRSIWQRLPVWPRLFGRMLIRSQSPDSSRKFTAPQISTPTASDIAADVVQRFIDQQRDAVSRLQTLDEEEATHAIMTSPFVRVITYSVLDGWRLVLAHDRRHIEQARRVTQSRGFPAR